MKLTKRIVACILFTSFLLIHFKPAFGHIEINEIFYNAPGSDNNLEFIELYSHNMPVLANFIIMDSASSDVLHPLKITNSSYALIVEEAFDFSNINASVYSAGATIGNNLDNSGDILTLFNPDKIIITTEIYDNTYANGNGYSLERFNSTFYESLVEGGTPGRKNSIQNLTATKECTFNITTSQIIYDYGERIDYDFTTNKKEFQITYWIEDLFDNIVKQKTNTTNTNKKYYTPVIDESETDKTFIIKATIISDSCKKNASTIVTAKGLAISTQSTLSLEKINLGSDNKAKFGETFNIGLIAYRGDTDQYKVKAWVEDNSNKVSETTEVELKDKYTSYALEIPVTLKDNCNFKFDQSMYELVVEGLNLERRREIIVADNPSCSKQRSYAVIGDSNAKSNKLSYAHLTKPSSAEYSFNLSTFIQNENKQHRFHVYSIIYRGSKRYFESQAETILISPNTNQTITNFMNISQIPDGDYKLKTLITKDDLKTPYAIITEITINKSEKISRSFQITSLVAAPSKSTDIVNVLENPTNFSPSLIQSKGAKIYSKMLYILALFMLMAIITLMLKIPKMPDLLMHMLRKAKII